MQQIRGFVGIGGSWKSTISNLLYSKYDFGKPINYTSRALREGETASDYIHITQDEFIQKLIQGDLVQYVQFKGNFYGIHRDSFDHNRVLIPGLLPESVIQIHKHATNIQAEFISIYLEVSEELCIQRMRSRGDSEESIQKRVTADAVTAFYGQRMCHHTIDASQTPEQIVSQIEKILGL